ncbi:hypothetical protein [Pontibacter russatus]|uniref:hypothetical protein n=1 Tax=Pontibacter russatus TaxID=2694929 RepID=UPI00137AAD9A|nr:hypothetical protein [Pontibacter russatus]
MASHLCEQRQVSGARCEGKRYLKKQYRRETQRQQQLPTVLRPAAARAPRAIVTRMPMRQAALTFLPGAGNPYKHFYLNPNL